MTTKPAGADDSAVDGRWVVAIFVVTVFVALLIWFVLGMPGMDHSSPGVDDMPEMETDDTMGTAGPLTRLSAADFDGRLSDEYVADLEGGMDALVAAGRSLVRDPREV
ncbi:hypothetical protein BH18ACT3_BH18ACT3_27790 [soil metagenome]